MMNAPAVVKVHEEYKRKTNVFLFFFVIEKTLNRFNTSVVIWNVLFHRTKVNDNGNVLFLSQITMIVGRHHYILGNQFFSYLLYRTFYCIFFRISISYNIRICDILYISTMTLVSKKQKTIKTVLQQYFVSFISLKNIFHQRGYKTFCGYTRKIVIIN